MNKSDKAALKDLWEKYGKDELFREIDTLINPSAEGDEISKSRPRGRIQTKTPEALATIYCIVREQMWRHNLNISGACKKVANTMGITIEGHEARTRLSAGVMGFDDTNIRQWYNDANKYRKEQPEDVHSHKMNLCDNDILTRPTSSEYEKEIQLIKEKYKL